MGSELWNHCTPLDLSDGFEYATFCIHSKWNKPNLNPKTRKTHLRERVSWERKWLEQEIWLFDQWHFVMQLGTVFVLFQPIFLHAFPNRLFSQPHSLLPLTLLTSPSINPVPFPPPQLLLVLSLLILRKSLIKFLPRFKVCYLYLFHV